MNWQSYETLYKGPSDRRLQHVLVIVVELADLLRYCSGTVLLLTERGVRVDLIVVSGPDETAPDSIGGLDRRTFTDISFLGHRPLELAEDTSLRSELVGHIRRLRPAVVMTVDPTPVLRQHPDHRAVARASMDAAWPYAGAEGAYPEHGAPAHPKEAWVYAGPSPDMFVRFEGTVQSKLAELRGAHAPPEEKFAQIDLRDRSSDVQEAPWPM